MAVSYMVDTPIDDLAEDYCSPEYGNVARWRQTNKTQNGLRHKVGLEIGW